MHAPVAQPFGTLPDGRAVSLYVLEAPGGWQAEITDYGAILVRMFVPAADGQPVDVVLGCDDLAGYLGTHPYFGATCGRVARRRRGLSRHAHGPRHLHAHS
jgi:aldose 1-epimerase